MEGGTTFTLVTDGAESAVDQAREAAGTLQARHTELAAHVRYRIIR